MNPAATLSVHLPRRVRPRPAPPGLATISRVARVLALAHEIERRVRSGELEDLAAAARVYGFTRARVTQITNLTLLAPSIQEEILAMPPVTKGREVVTERALRPIVAEPMWERQVEMWKCL